MTTDPAAPAAPLPTPPADPMGLALALAAQAIGLTDPNPRVGCVITAPDGRVIGQGHTQQAGGPHAEVMALRDARAAGEVVQGATAWVTLEPCAHHGRTPPCCDALIAAGLARVVIAAPDPNPLVDGEGRRRMRAAGIDVVDGGAEQRAASRALNVGFFSRMERQRPWVRMKIATSADGRSALPDGRSQWITGPEARADGHAWRRRAGAVLTGVGTILSDDPGLDVRLVPTARQPLRVILDSRLRTPPQARLLHDGRGPVLILTTADVDAPCAQALRHAGAELLPVASCHGRPDLGAVLQALHERQINELHLEAGATLNGAWLAANLVDECLIYLAPSFIGPGRPAAELATLADLAQARRFAWLDSAPVGADLRLRMARLPPVGP